ncbi:YihY/virulence factor BrkB family protein [Streptomyces sp. DH37]|uniref:YihY/virulence factor BrkB family protein n=1 Tax=Streptomyces sp. DH37 TaxID=3040122 RepID=UPI00244175A9|nr:YihY/virulence factor BrkB family protein [Streptomyces sp. DH37]MDG9702689.1 YihY/virulence factor BrkB family protein [Streptomyces sp. DH37]
MAKTWWAVARGTVKEFLDDEIPDRAATLTYYGVLSIFPALLLLVSLLGTVGETATEYILENLRGLAPGPAREILSGTVGEIQRSSGGGFLAIVSLLGAVWASSGYVAAFIRAANRVLDIPEGRPVWKLTPLRIGVTLVLMVLLAVSAVIVVFTGGVAEQIGAAVGMGEQALLVWSIAKWPVLVLLVASMISILYWSAPNARMRGLRMAPGSVLAVLLWLAASAGFAVYTANFGSYNKTYGTLAGAVVFLVWLWLSNLAILLGLELDAELARRRAYANGLPKGEEPYVEPRDTAKWPRSLRRELRRRRKERRTREAAGRTTQGPAAPDADPEPGPDPDASRGHTLGKTAD